VAVEQLCFFKFQRPLLDRFGKEFFSSVPHQPGVYLFSSEQGRPLYVGHSKDLRTRLSYYKNAQPEREPRRIVRLVHQVRKIELECHETLDAAQLRELALIRQLRPRFNVANTLSPTYSYFGFRTLGGRFSLRLSMSEAKVDGESRIGAFRNRGLCARAFIAIARTIVAHAGLIHSAFDFPAWLNVRAREWQFEENCRAMLHAFIGGEDDAFLARAVALTENTSDPFLRQIFETDLLTLSEFFVLAQEMAQLRIALDTPVVSQEALQVSQRLIRSHNRDPVARIGIAEAETVALFH
jgi:hypothetical protein